MQQAYKSDSIYRFQGICMENCSQKLIHHAIQSNFYRVMLYASAVYADNMCLNPLVRLSQVWYSTETAKCRMMEVDKTPIIYQQLC